MACVWDSIEPGISKAQRRALYRLGVSRSRVQRMTAEQAEAVIAVPTAEQLLARNFATNKTKGKK